MAIVFGAHTVQKLETLWHHSLQDIGEIGDTARRKHAYRTLVYEQCVMYTPHASEVVLSRCPIQPTVHQHVVCECVS